MTAEAVLRSLLTGLVDHSGVFPPTALDFDAALKKTVGFKTSLTYPFLIGSEMVIPFVDLAKLDGLDLKAIGYDRPLFRICAVDDGSLEKGERVRFSQNLEFCFRVYEENEAARRPQKITSYEGRVGEKSPALLLESAATARAADFILFGEHDLSGDGWEDVLAQAVEIKAPGVGFKARTSGPAGIKADRLSRVIESVTARDIPFKVTGGLHYPYAGEHGPLGFLSLTIAVALARSFNLEAALIGRILESDHGAFGFTEKTLSWDKYSMGTEEIELAMRKTHFSVGCCNPAIQDVELKKLFG